MTKFFMAVHQEANGNVSDHQINLQDLRYGFIQNSRINFDSVFAINLQQWIKVTELPLHAVTVELEFQLFGATDWRIQASGALPPSSGQSISEGEPVRLTFVKEPLASQIEIYMPDLSEDTIPPTGGGVDLVLGMVRAIAVPITGEEWRSDQAGTLIPALPLLSRVNVKIPGMETVTLLR